MSVRSRVVFASGVAAAAGALLVLSGRYDGGVVLAVILVVSIRTAGLGVLVGAGPVVAADAVRELNRRALLAPVWCFAIAAGVLRAGSTSLADIRGANAVAGLALAQGPVATVAGCWLALGAAVLAVTTRPVLGAETSGPAGSVGRLVPPSSTARMDAIGVLAESGLLATLFFGPQVVDRLDALWWIAGGAVVVALAWARSRLGLRGAPSSPFVPIALGAAGLVLVLAGGSP